MHNQKLEELEQKVAKLEREMQEVKDTVAQRSQPWWKQMAGTFKGDKAFAEIVRLGRKIRQEDRDGDQAKGKTNSRKSRKKRIPASKT